MTISTVFSILSLFIALASLAVAIKGWHKNRAYYDIESTFFRADTIKDLKDKLNSGEYTIISTFQDEFKNVRIILGRIKRK